MNNTSENKRTIEYEIGNNKIEINVSIEIAEYLEKDETHMETMERYDREFLSGEILDTVAETFVDCNTLDDLSSILIKEIESAGLQAQEDKKYCKLHTAIGKLTRKQKDRIYKYFFLRMNYSEIAREENISHTAVIKSIDSALAKLNKLI